jgi:dihydrofolate reductase
MGRFIVTAQMTLDAVIDQVDGWFNPRQEAEAYFGPAAAAGDGAAPMPHSFDLLRGADAMVLGRRTYEGLSTVWPPMQDPFGFADRVNSMPKYVASRTLSGPLDWNATLIQGDVAERVAELKQSHAGNLLSYGCGELASSLIRCSPGLVDEIRLWVHPIAFGAGIRPFQEGETPVKLRLIGATTFSSGVVLLSYQPLG